jgi:hypothetical protein
LYPYCEIASMRLVDVEVDVEVDGDVEGDGDLDMIGSL